MIAVFANPELVRNRRAQLRRGRVVACILICGVLSVVTAYALASQSRGAGGSTAWGEGLVIAALWAQAAALVFGGGMACLQAIQRERDANTFDYQRVTRLTAMELTIGKWLGAPATAYLITVCLLPAALIGAWVGGIGLPRLVLACAALLAGGLCFHALALMLSLLTSRPSAAAIMFLGVLSLAEAVPATVGMGSLSPFAAAGIVSGARRMVTYSPTVDVFFGREVSHAVVMAVIWAVFAGWFLLPVARNIKKDPATWELLTPAQAVGLAFCVDLVVVGFFRWLPENADATMRALLVANSYLFLAVGMLLFRSRDRSRRLHLAGPETARRAMSRWPVPYVVVGALVAGLAIASMAASTAAFSAAQIGFGAFSAALAALVAARDVAYLQWMNVRRARHPLLMGLIYLVVFYLCIVVLAATAVDARGGEMLMGAFAPWGIAAVSVEHWLDLWPAWGVIAALQVAAIAFFTRQHGKVLATL